jgi:hypothetical protein
MENRSPTKYTALQNWWKVRDEAATTSPEIFAAFLMEGRWLKTRHVESYVAAAQSQSAFSVVQPPSGPEQFRDCQLWPAVI